MSGKLKYQATCPKCGQSAGSAWNWVLPKARGICASCSQGVSADNSTRSRQAVGLIFAIMAALMALGLLLGGEKWLIRAVFGAALYLGFNLWAVNRVSLK